MQMTLVSGSLAVSEPPSPSSLQLPTPFQHSEPRTKSLISVPWSHSVPEEPWEGDGRRPQAPGNSQLCFVAELTPTHSSGPR